MKTLLIISSIILISFQIDRLLTNYFSGSSNETTLFDNAYRLSPVTPNSTTRYAVEAQASKKNEPVVVSTYEEEVEIQPEVKTVQLAAVSLTRNQKNSLFHQSVKESGNFIMLSSLHFNFNQFEKIDTEEFNTIMDFADLLIFNDSLKVSIAGFTDNSGDPAYNSYLSHLRAQNVRDYLIDLGVKDQQIIVSANGISNPIASNGTREGRAANRRVEMLLMK
ncbi:MAG: OmpA family protein [Chitinophagaceae bacterium]|nr:OmpA family protein [Chitinophagaceae bacterium]